MGSPWLATGSYSVRTKLRPSRSFLNTSRPVFGPKTASKIKHPKNQKISIKHRGRRHGRSPYCKEDQHTNLQDSVIPVLWPSAGLEKSLEVLQQLRVPPKSLPQGVDLHGCPVRVLQHGVVDLATKRRSKTLLRRECDQKI